MRAEPPAARTRSSPASGAALRSVTFVAHILDDDSSENVSCSNFRRPCHERKPHLHPPSLRMRDWKIFVWIPVPRWC